MRESRKAYSILEREQTREKKREKEEKKTSQALKWQAESDRQIAETLVNEVRKLGYYYIVLELSE